MPRGRKKRNRLRQKRFEEEIVDTSQNIFAAIGVNLKMLVKNNSSRPSSASVR